MAGGGVAALAVAGLFLSPAFGAQNSVDRKPLKRAVSLIAPNGLASFTPASADPRLAASLSRAGLPNGFRFTPSGATRNGTRQITVAVRALSNTGRIEADRLAAGSSVVSITPVAYNLGVAVGWKRFALAGDVAKIDMGPLPGGREKMDVGLSYSGNQWSTRVQVGKEAPIASEPRLLSDGERYSVDLGGSYSLTRNLDVTAGLRYQTQRDRDRLQALDDGRRDSQAVYIGTAFKF
ncbi:MAG: hypothetical protein ABS87_02655 [Sphingomonas sp. SCN 67-18]|nr:porin [Sphingomonas sp. SCN 67-18]ODU22351.1 MAG: hypothetical protein ABS87_02655 [Sphingomonas sp. SCN 67-18]